MHLGLHLKLRTNPRARFNSTKVTPMSLELVLPPAFSLPYPAANSFSLSVCCIFSLDLNTCDMLASRFDTRFLLTPRVLSLPVPA